MLGRENGELLAPFLPHFLIFYTFPNTSASTAISFIYCPYTRSRVAPGDRLFSGCPEKTAECGVLGGEKSPDYAKSSEDGSVRF